MASGATVSTWYDTLHTRNAVGYGAPKLRQADAARGGYWYVEFQRASSQYFTLGGDGPLQIRFSDGAGGKINGVTALAVVAYEGGATGLHRIFDFGNGEAKNNIVFGRFNSTSNSFAEVFNASASGFNYGGTIVDDEIGMLQLVTMSYDHAANTITLYTDGIVGPANNATGMANLSAALPDRTLALATCFIGKSNYTFQLFQGRMAELAFYPTVLTAERFAKESAALFAKYGRGMIRRTNLALHLDPTLPPQAVEFPPGPLTAAATTLGDGYTYGAGTYLASASSTYVEPSYSVFAPFDKVAAATNSWCVSSAAYNGTTGAYQPPQTNTFTTAVDGGVVAGEWLQLQLPQPIALTSFTTTAVNTGNFKRTVRDLAILGSNNGTRWSRVGPAVTSLIFSSMLQSQTVAINCAVRYRFYRFVVVSIQGGLDSFASVGKLRLFGDPSPVDSAVSVAPLADLSGNSVAVVPVGAARVVAPSGANASWLFTDYGWLSTGLKPTLYGNSWFSYEAWFYYPKGALLSGHTALVSNSGSPALPSNYWMSGLHVDSAGYLRAFDGDQVAYIASAAFPIDQWVHAVMACSTTTITLYVDGVLAITANRTGGGGGLSSSQGYNIGGGTAGRGMAIAMGPVRVYVGTTLSAQDVSRHYNAEKARVATARAAIPALVGDALHLDAQHAVPPTDAALPIATAPKIWLRLEELSALADGASVASWPSVVGTAVAVGLGTTLPVMTRPATGQPFVRMGTGFSSSSTSAAGGGFALGKQTFNMATSANGAGFTAVCLVRMRASPAAAETVFDFGASATGTNTLSLTRSDMGKVGVVVRNGTTKEVDVTLGGVDIPSDWAVIAVRVSATATAFWSGDGTLTSTTVAATMTDRTLTGCFIGRSWAGAAFASMDVREIMFFEGALSDAEVGMLRGYLAAKYVALPLAPVTPTLAPKIWLRMDELSGMADGAEVASWSSAVGTAVATGSAAGSGTKPAVNRTLEAFPFVRMGTGTSSTANGGFFNCGSQTFNVATNGGFTVVCAVRFFASDLPIGDRVFDFGSGQGTNNLILYRTAAGTTSFNFYTMGSTNNVLTQASGAISQGAWQIVACRVTPSASTLWLNDGNKGSIGAASAVTDRTLSNCYIGKSFWTSDSYSSVDIREMMFFDGALSDNEVGMARAYMSTKFGAPIALTKPVAASPVTAPKIWLRMEELYAVADGSPVNAWASGVGNAVAVGNQAGTGVLPKINRTAETYPYVRMGTDTDSDANGGFFNLGSQTFNTLATGGFTAICAVRLRSNIAYERIFHHGSSTNNADAFIMYGNKGKYTIGSWDAAGVSKVAASSQSIVFNAWAVLGVRITASDITLVNNDGTSAVMTGVMLTNRTSVATYIGKSWNPSDNYSNMDVREMMFFDGALSDFEIATLRAKLALKFASALPASSLPAVQTATSPKIWLRMEDLGALPHGADVNAWASAVGSAAATGIKVGTGTKPSMNRMLETFPFVRMGTGTSSLDNGGYFDIGSQTFNTLTNTGFTAVCAIRLRGPASKYERVFDFYGSGVLNRLDTTMSFTAGYSAADSTGGTGYNIASAITGGWQTVAMRITASEIAFFAMDGTKTINAGATLGNRTSTYTYIGKSNYAGAGASTLNYYANLDVREMMFFDAALSDAEIGSLQAKLAAKFALPLPATAPVAGVAAPKIWLRMDELAGLAHGAEVASWASAAGSAVATGSKAGTGAKPVVNRTLESQPFVRMGTDGRSATNGGYLDIGSQSFNMASNGGFTAVCAVRLRSSVTTTSSATYPPAMTSNSTVVTNVGTFVASSTGERIDGVWKLFDGAASSGQYDSTWMTWDGTYSGTVAINIRVIPGITDGYAGEWAMLKMPVGVYAASYQVGGGMMAWRLYGTMDPDGTSGWFQMDDRDTGATAPTWATITPYTMATPGWIRCFALKMRKAADNIGFGRAGMHCLQLTTASVVGDTLGVYEPVFDFASGTPSNNVSLLRTVASSNTDFYARVYNAAAGAVGQAFGKNENGWQVVAVRHTSTTTDCWTNNAAKTSYSTVVTLSDRTQSNCYVGRSWISTDPYANLDVREMMFFDGALSDVEVERCRMYMVAKYAPVVSPSSSVRSVRGLPKIWLRMDELSTMAHGASVNAWPSATGSATAYGLKAGTGAGYVPKIDATSEPFPFVRMGTGTDSLTDGGYFDLGKQTWSQKTNGGFTAVLLVRLWSTAYVERVFEFVNGSENLIMWRDARTASISTTVTGAGMLSGIILTTATAITGGWTVLATRTTGNTIDFWNGTGTKSTTVALPAVPPDMVASTNYIGKSFWNSNAYANMDVREMMFFDGALTDVEVGQARAYLLAKYPTPSAALAMVPSLPVARSPKLWLRMEDLGGIAHDALVATWPGAMGCPSATGTGVGTGTQPKVARTTDASYPFVRMGTGAASVLNGGYLDFGAQTFNMTTNGGFTAVCAVRMWGADTSGSYERLFDFSTGRASNNILMARRGATTTSFVLHMYTGSTEQVETVGMIPQSTWQIVAGRYTPTEGTFFLDNGTKVTSSGCTLTDRALTNCFIGKSPWGDAYASLDVREMMFFDGALSDNEIAMLRGALAAKFASAGASAPATWQDRSGNGNDLALTACSVDTGGGVRFDGATSFGYRSNLLGFSSKDAYTLVAWVQAADVVGNGSLIGMNRTPANATASYAWNVNSFFDTASASGFSSATTAPANIASASQWCMLAFVKERSTGRFYLDGTRSSADLSAAVNVAFSAASLCVGKDFRDGVRFFNGSMGLLAAFNRALTDAEVTAMHELYRGRFTPAYKTLAPVLLATSTSVLVNASTSLVVISLPALLMPTANATAGRTSWSMVGAPTAGVALNRATGDIRVSKGTTLRNVTLTVTATNPAGTATRALLINPAFPPVPLTANSFTIAGAAHGNGAYVASASTELASTGLAFHAFNAGTSATGWAPNGSVYSAAGVYTGAVTTTAFVDATTAGGSYVGEWLQLTMPQTIQLSSYTVACKTAASAPQDWVLLGSLDSGATWKVIDARTAVPGYSLLTPKTFAVTSTNVSYSTFRMAVSKSSGASLAVYDMRFYNTSGTSYGEPAAAAATFAVPSFPPSPLAADTSAFSGLSNGFGTYTATASSFNSATQNPSAAFMLGTAAASKYWATETGSYTATTGAYTPGATGHSTMWNGTETFGEWLQLRMPQPIMLTSYTMSHQVVGRAPRDWVLLGSNDGGATFVLLDTRTGVTSWSTSVAMTFTVTDVFSAYSTFRIVVTKNQGTESFLGIGDVRMFGVPVSDTLVLRGPTFDLGASNMAPWNVSDFPDTSARWIWSSKGAETSGAAETVSLYAHYYNASGASIAATLRMQCDNYAVVKLNGVTAFDGTTTVWTARTVTTITLAPGANVLRFDATNSVTGAAGLIASVVANNVVLIRTNGTWTSGHPQAGLVFRAFDTYHSEATATFFDTTNHSSIGLVTDFTNLATSTKNNKPVNTLVCSVEWVGYVLATVSGTWTFSVGSDDGSYMWIGPTAISGYTVAAALINNGGAHPMTLKTGTYTMAAGVAYPIRIQYGNSGGNGDCRVGFLLPGSATETFNGAEFLMPGDCGKNGPAFTVASARIAKAILPAAPDGIYNINVNGTPTRTYCLMDSKWDGGGWMLLMKATRGTTFNYNATYWTSDTTTLNPTELTRSVDADAKYNAFNHVRVKDIMAHWPDIVDSKGASITGGSIAQTETWTWLVNNYYGSGALATLITGLAPVSPTLSRDSPTAPDPKLFTGFDARIWSTQEPTRRHVLGGGTHITANQHTRWGFIWNENGLGDFTSSDVSGGIGMTHGTYSSGDYVACCHTSVGLNRSMRVQLYGR